MATTYSGLPAVDDETRLDENYFNLIKTNQEYFRSPNQYNYVRALGAGSYSIANATYTDMDATNLKDIPLTFTGNPVVVKLWCGLANISAGYGAIQLLLDGVAVCGGADMLRHPTTGDKLYFEWLFPTMSAGAHTFTVQFRSNSGANTFTLVVANGFWFRIKED